MYQEHPSFLPPSPDAVLWRYMDFTKFASLIDTESLFFAKSDKLGDPFEGSLSQVNVDLRPSIYGEEIASKISKAISGSDYERLRQYILISCWHESSYESDAMWARYSRLDDGVAIKTNFQALANSLVCDTEVFIGQVSYVDYQATFIPEENMFDRYLHKRKGFEHEKEVRAIVMRFPSNVMRSPSKKVNDDGEYFEVNLSKLIHEVVVAPFAPDWFFELVKSVATRYCITAPVTKSSMADSPVWG